MKTVTPGGHCRLLRSLLQVNKLVHVDEDETKIRKRARLSRAFFVGLGLRTLHQGDLFQ